MNCSRTSRLFLLVVCALATTHALAGEAAAPAPSVPATVPTPAEARARLGELWSAEDLDQPAPPLLAAAAEHALPAPQRKSLVATSVTSFEEPVTLRSRDGELSLTLVGVKAYNRIGADPVYLRSYNGQLVGPTLRARPGDTIRVRLENRLTPDTTGDGPMNTLHDFNTMNLHTHGLHVSPSGNSDNVLLEIKSGENKDFAFVIPADHPAGTFWYHPHKHGSTAAQVASGMSGALIIEGGMDQVPEIAAARERVFVLQQIAYLYKNCFPGPKPEDPPVCYDLPYGVIEQRYVDRLFGPGSWNELGRHTTINGQVLPVLRLRPGEIERWRFIHSGMRERLELKLEAAKSPSGAPPVTVPLHMIAADGLSLGKVDTLQTVELWPGYRADVLVQAPPAPGEYLLLDEETPAAESLNNQAEPRKYLARVIVEGEPRSMRMPTDAQLAPFRLPSIPSRAVNRHREMSYGIIRKPGGGILFGINRKTFDPTNVLRLDLNETEEWTLTSQNEVGPVSHPFHIHVNPFEIVSMIDDKGVERLREPIWRDTVILHENWKVKMRTHYTDFTGAFVQHCHILDHEDQGMMQIVEIRDPAKPDAPSAVPANLMGGHASAAVAASAAV
ncbi:MAG: multicopper oxidase domain-containing protein, partial [Burkholderiales bacterium]|nr:multicopper oxidase domain-containing protein [Opitutaceae bacterium]